MPDLHFGIESTPTAVDDEQPLLERADDVGQLLSSEVDSVLEHALIGGQSIRQPLMGDEQLATLGNKCNGAGIRRPEASERPARGNHQAKISVNNNVPP